MKAVDSIKSVRASVWHLLQPLPKVAGSTPATARHFGNTSFRIARIDRRIDEVLAELKRREPLGLGDAASWQRRYDRNPELYQRMNGLYLLRGQEQAYRDRMANKQWERAERRRIAAERAAVRREFRAAKCPTCGHHTLTTQAA